MCEQVFELFEIEREREVVKDMEEVGVEVYQSSFCQ
jgi:hypothetical protein